MNSISTLTFSNILFGTKVGSYLNQVEVKTTNAADQYFDFF